MKHATRRPTALALAAAALLPAAARAQVVDRPYYGPYSVYGPGLTYRQPSFYYGPLGTTFLQAQTTVTVPDGGTRLVAGYGAFREGRHEFGAPVLGKVPVLGRPFRNVGYGREVQSSTVSVRARIIDLREMDEQILRGGR